MTGRGATEVQAATHPRADGRAPGTVTAQAARAEAVDSGVGAHGGGKHVRACRAERHQLGVLERRLLSHHSTPLGHCSAQLY